MEMSVVVESIWKAMDKQYFSKDKGSEDLMNKIMHGPAVNCHNLKALSEFVADCSLATSFFDNVPSLKLQYDTENTLKCVFRRLEPSLRSKWPEWTMNKQPQVEADRVPFHLFSAWITKIYESKR